MTTAQQDASAPGAGDAETSEAAGHNESGGFVVTLENFSGPFDLLLGLISKRKLDITDVALAEVTDEFIAYVTALRAEQSLDELSNFLLVAATLLDLKTDRLLPRGDVDDELDLELLEARDLLFARLLQYRAYKAVSAVFAEQMAHAATRTARSVPLEEGLRDILPPLEITATPQVLAAIYATVLQRDHTPPTVSTDHLHLPQISVAEQRTVVLTRLGQQGQLTFSDLIADAESTMVVVARFLALLELFKAGMCDFDQPAPLGELTVVAAEAADLATIALPDTDEWDAPTPADDEEPT
ncbi:segregation and condensation protein A [Brevibacterium luteolum]|uniref:segregation and condensation protein A n=1 Tax=Brevibacterium luteolum TaxID=199591 RepID=UPI003EE93F67